MHILFIGDDERFEYAKKYLREMKVMLHENPPFEHIILPMRGVDEKNLNEIMVLTNKDGLYYYNNQTPYFKKIKEFYHLNCFYLNDDENFFKVNNLATAEAILAKVISMTKKNLNEQRILILGYGACGQPIADLLQKLDANLVIAARREEVRKKIMEKELIAISFDELMDVINDFDVIINTVPEIVIDDEMLHIIQPKTIILDVATAPGGLNHETALALGLNTLLLPGLPGLYAPQSSGKALAELIFNKEIFK